MKIARLITLLLVLAFSQSVAALAMVEFLQLDNVAQYKVVQPMILGFLKAGYKKIPDNEFTLIGEMRKITLEKGYTYQNVEDVAKEAALRLGMTR